VSYVSRWRRNEKGELIREFVLEHEVNVSLVGMGPRNMRGEVSVVELQGREQPEAQATSPQTAGGPVEHTTDSDGSTMPPTAASDMNPLSLSVNSWFACIWPLPPVRQHWTDDRCRGDADGRSGRSCDREGS
jgi:hypothetical protein